MRLCIRKSDRRIIEAQSGSVDDGVLLKNALVAGYTVADVEVQIVSDLDGNSRLLQQSKQDAINKPKTQEQLDVEAASAIVAVQTLRNMTPTQAQSWVAANVNTLAEAKSLLSTMAAVLCILARRL